MTALAAAVAQVSLSTSLLLGPLLLLLPLLRKTYAPRWRHAVWLLLAVRLLLPFAPTLPNPPVRIPAPNPVLYTPPAALPVQPALPEPLPAAGTPALPGDVAAAAPITLGGLLAWVWLLGVAALVLAQGAACLRFYCRVLRGSRPVQSPLFERLAAGMGLQGRVRLRCSARVTGPMAAGLWRPVVLLPLRQYPPELLELVLRHELTHCRRRDVASKLLLAAACTLHWFNPLVWWMTRQAGQDIELCCDAQVLAALGPGARRAYADAVLGAMRQGGGVLLSTAFGSGLRQAKARFAAIFDGKARRRGFVALGALALCTGAVGLLVACGGPELLTETHYEQEGRVYTLAQPPRDGYEDVCARLGLYCLQGDWEGMEELDATGVAANRARQERQDGAAPDLLEMLELRTLPADLAQAGLDDLLSKEAAFLEQQVQEQQGALAEGRIVYLRFRQTLPKTGQGQLYADGEYLQLVYVGRAAGEKALRVYGSGARYMEVAGVLHTYTYPAGAEQQDAHGAGEPQPPVSTAPPPEDPLPAYIKEMADRDFSLRSDAGARNTLTLERGVDGGAAIPGVPWRLAPALVEAGLRPAQPGETGNLPVNYPFQLHYASWEGQEDIYRFENGYILYQGANYLAENPQPLLEELAEEDFLSRQLITLGSVLGITPSQVTSLRVQEVPYGSDLTLHGEVAVAAATTLLEGWLSPLAAGEQRNPDTGGACTYTFTVEGDMLYTVHDNGLVSINGGEYTYISVYLPTPPLR